ncbi:MAG TPA: hypothetical protein VKA37_04980 [Halobacteriales archaeon]|nr:hypothetical protein [Halobacteriales archaeon]
MPSTDERERYVLIGVVVVAVAALLYGVLVLGNPLAWLGAALPLVALYLFWRLVRAHERIAAALE